MKSLSKALYQKPFIKSLWKGLQENILCEVESVDTSSKLKFTCWPLVNGGKNIDGCQIIVDLEAYTVVSKWT